MLAARRNLSIRLAAQPAVKERKCPHSPLIPPKTEVPIVTAEDHAEEEDHAEDRVLQTYRPRPVAKKYPQKCQDAEEISAQALRLRDSAAHLRVARGREDARTPTHTHTHTHTRPLRSQFLVPSSRPVALAQSAEDVCDRPSDCGTGTSLPLYCLESANG